MSAIVNIHEAKSRLSQLIEQVERGEQVTIARAGKPVAKLVALKPQKPRRLGLLEGKYAIPESILEPLPDEIVRLFEHGE